MKKIFVLAIVSASLIGCASPSPKEAWMDGALNQATKGNTKAIDCMDRWFENDAYLHKCPLMAFNK